jgi:DNA uptake protein ComE-like DNA-binding protein
MSRMKSVTSLAVALGLVAGSIAYAQGGSTPSSTPGSSGSKTAAASAHTKSMKAPAVAKCDLNTASKDELMKFSGIDDAVADKIIADRPFKSKGDLVSKGIVTKEAYAKISSHLIAKKAAVAK